MVKRTLIALLGAFLILSCHRVSQMSWEDRNCYGGHPPNRDSLMNGRGGLLRVTPDTSVSPGWLAGVILDWNMRRPILNAEIRVLPSPSKAATVDSTGRFSLRLPTTERFILDTRAVGFEPRRDSLVGSQVSGTRIELTLLHAVPSQCP